MSVRRWSNGFLAAACAVGMASPALAQQRPAPRPSAAAPVLKADPAEMARNQIAVMESVLETAVQRGGLLMTRQWRSAAPEMLLMGGTARARGFRLDGYGLFFVVDVPALSRTVVWTWRMLDRESGGSDTAVASIKDFIKSVPDPAKRKELEQAIRRLEIQVTPYSRLMDPNGRAADNTRNAAGTGATMVSQGGVTGGVTGSAPGAPATPAPGLEIMTDPDEAYTNVVKDALIDAMLDYSQALTVAPEESFTVAARGYSAQSLGTDDSGELMTITIRIKGSDLQAMRAGRITRDEARKRVEIREY